MTSPYFPFSVTMTLVKRVLTGTQDAYGNDVYTEKNIQVSNCVFQPGGSSENTSFADQSNTSDTIYVPYGTDVTYLDAIIYNGIKFEITGVPNQWVSPFSGRVSPIRVEVSKIEGVTA
jgi:hypothetical protein